MRTIQGRRNSARKKSRKGRPEGRWESIGFVAREINSVILIPLLFIFGILFIFYVIFLKPDPSTVRSGEIIDQLCRELGHEKMLDVGWTNIAGEKAHAFRLIACSDEGESVTEGGRFSLVSDEDLRILLDGRKPWDTPQGDEPTLCSAHASPAGENLSVRIPREFVDNMAAAYEVHSGEFLACLYGSKKNGTYGITRMGRSVLETSTPGSILAHCPDRQGLIAELHSHPGSSDPSHACLPSSADNRVHKERGQPLQGIFCGGDRIGFFTTEEPTKSLPVIFLNSTDGEAAVG